MFRGLESGEMLAIEVVADGGYSLNREVVERLHIEAINDTFAHIIDALMMLDVAPTEDVGDRVEPLRLALTKSLFVRMAA